MEKEMFRGKPVLFAVDCLDTFYADLFCMIDDHLSDLSVIERDDICRHHFHSLLSRLCDICYCHEVIGDFGDILTVVLGSPAEGDKSE